MGERRPEERRGPEGKQREEGEEEERIGSICQSPAGSLPSAPLPLSPSASWRNSEERDKRPVVTQKAGSSHQGPEAALCEGQAPGCHGPGLHKVPSLGEGAAQKRAQTFC